jgi:uncharacterized protein
VELTPVQIRVLGCLIEKRRTTPESYPLTINSLRLACNQATNRDPVVDYGESEVREAAGALGRRRLVRLASGQGSRATKYRHVANEALDVGDAELALLCVLMLRGPQTPGELKGRTDRIHGFAGLDEVHATLERLIERELVAQVERVPGQKEDRYDQLLGGGDDGAGALGSPASMEPEGERERGSGPEDEREPGSGPEPRAASEAGGSRDLERRVGELEERVGKLSEALAALRRDLGDSAAE